MNKLEPTKQNKQTNTTQNEKQEKISFQTVRNEDKTLFQHGVETTQLWERQLAPQQ